MAYDHSTKIGNCGDLVKHAVLSTVVDKMLANHLGVFEYVETHSGRAEYILPGTGEWKQGIGQLTWSSSDIEHCKPYLEGFFGKSGNAFKPPSCGQRYPGSSGIVFGITQQRKSPFQFTLHDTDAMVVADLRRFYSPWPHVNIMNVDGLAGLRRLSRTPSLVLIDPPNLQDRSQIIEAMTLLSTAHVPFICWTPRNANPGDAKEANATSSFHEDTRQWSRLRVRWGTWKQQGTRGCQLTMYPNSVLDYAKPVVTEIVEMMGDPWAIC